MRINAWRSFLNKIVNKLLKSVQNWKSYFEYAHAPFLCPTVYNPTVVGVLRIVTKLNVQNNFNEY